MFHYSMLTGSLLGFLVLQCFQALGMLLVVRLQIMDSVGTPWAFLLLLPVQLLILRTDMILVHFGHTHPYLPRIPHRLPAMGIYARNRHPRFWLLFLTTLAWGLLVGVPSRFLLIIGLAYFLIIGLILRFVWEGMLVGRFGADYVSHRARVPFLTWRLHLPEYERYPLLTQVATIAALIWFRLRYQLSFSGLEHIPDRPPFLVVAPHESYLDPFFFGILIPYRVYFITTADVFTSGWMRFLLRGVNTFPVERHRQDLTSIRTMLRLTADQQVVCIFPEGGRTMDGDPQPILPETIRLIQKCGVPILPVKLEGAYEIWPRWAPNRRRSRIQVSFQPVIPVSKQHDIATLTNAVREGIFPAMVEWQPTTGTALSPGIDALLWGCPACGAHESIVIRSDRDIQCRHCQAEWQISDTYQLVATDGSSISPGKWLQELRSRITPRIGADGTAHFLEGSIASYRGPDEGFKDARLTLTDRSFALSAKGHTLEWALERITIFTVDFGSAFSLGVGGQRHRFLLPAGETPLKWEDHFNAAQNWRDQIRD